MKTLNMKEEIQSFQKHHRPIATSAVLKQLPDFPGGYAEISRQAHSELKISIMTRPSRQRHSSGTGAAAP